MRLHRFALFLLGWYLLMPLGDPSEPMSRWEQIDAYETLAVCQGMKQHLRQDAMKIARERSKSMSLPPGAPLPDAVVSLVRSATAAVCVETGDQRLAR